MKKNKIILVGATLLISAAVALIFYQDYVVNIRVWRPSQLFSAASTFFIANESPSAQVISEPKSTEEPVQAETILTESKDDSRLLKLNSSPPSKFILPKNTVVAVLPADDSQVLPEIKEQIIRLELPPQITETICQPVFPLLSEEPAESQNNDLTLNGQGGGPAEETILPPDASTSTPATSTLAWSDFDFFLSGYSLTARQFSANWHSSSTEVLFDVQGKEGDQEWWDWAMATSSGTKIFSVPRDETVYHFRARVQIAISTSTATTSPWSYIEAPIDFWPVVINEVAWAGTGTSSKARSDEWLELFNKTDYTIDLNGWSLARPNGTTTSLIVALKNSIGPKAYYLIERTDDTAVADVPADLAKSFGGGGLDNSGEDLILLDGASQIIDRLNFSAGWPAGSAGPDYLSLERVNPYLMSDILSNWQSNNTQTRDGQNVDGQPINGTPKAPNSVFNPGLFYLSVASTTATSTQLFWTESHLPDLKEYRVHRWLGLASSSPGIIGTTTSAEINYSDNLLAPATNYNYKVAVCDNLDYCVASNVVSVITPALQIELPPEQIVGVDENSEIDLNQAGM